MKNRPGSGERAFRALLRVCPRPFREEYEHALLELFRYRRARRLGERGTLGIGFWMFIVRDIATVAWRERLDPIPVRSVRTTTVGDGMMRGWIDDIAYAARRLWRSPGFSATALVILVLGIGVNTTAFSVVNAVLFQPPPFPDSESLVDVLQDSDDGRPNSTSYPAFEDIARTEGVFASVAAVDNAEGFLEQGDGLVRVALEYATSEYMNVLGLRTTRGRWFEADEDVPGGPPAAVVSHKMWRDRMASDPSVIGRTLRIGGGSVTVVGIGPAEFNGGAGPAVSDMWLSISALGPTGAFAAGRLDRREDHPFNVRARLLPGVSTQQAQASMDRLAGELAATYPELNEGRRISVIPLADTRIHPEVDGDLVPAAALLMGVVILVLLIATLNLANLLLVRTTARAREIAVRLAMGAGRARVTRVVLSEALVLAALGGAGGLAAAVWIVSMLNSRTVLLDLPVILDVRLDTSVLVFAAGASLLSGIVFGLVPALRVTGRDLSASLRDEAAVSIGARRRFGMTGALVAGQVAVSLLLLAVAGVFVDSLVRAGGSDPGFEWERTAYAQVSLTPLGLDARGAAAMYQTIEERIEARPEIEAVTMSLQLPGAQFGSTTMLLGSGLGGVDKPTEIPWNLVGLDYFAVMGIRLVEGRFLLPGDGDAPVAIVSEAMARAYWGRTNVVGEAMFSENAPDQPVEIIGVVSDVAVRSLGEAPTPSIYWPYTAGGASRAYLTVKTTGDPDRAAAAARDVIREVDPRILITGSMTMEDHLGNTLGEQRLAGSVLSGMGLLALLLSVLGVYGVVSFAVSRRKREVGIRQALGADGSAVIGLFVRDVAGVVVTGTLVGLALAIPAGRYIGAEFTGGGASPLMIGAVALALLGTALLATIIPAARAARIDPTETLSQE